MIRELLSDADMITDRSESGIPDSLSSEECVELFGMNDAVAMNFTPRMITAIAIEWVEAVITYFRDNRLTEFKKHSRELHKCINEYNRELKYGYGNRFDEYKDYFTRFRETVDFDLYKSWITFCNESSRQYVGRKHNEIPARICFILMLITFVEDFGRSMDRMIGEKLGTKCSRSPNPWLQLIKSLCIDIVETYEQKMEITEIMKLCVSVLAQRCREVVLEIIEEETEESEETIDNN